MITVPILKPGDNNDDTSKLLTAYFVIMHSDYAEKFEITTDSTVIWEYNGTNFTAGRFIDDYDLSLIAKCTVSETGDCLEVHGIELVYENALDPEDKDNYTSEAVEASPLQELEIRAAVQKPKKNSSKYNNAPVMDPFSIFCGSDLYDPPDDDDSPFRDISDFDGATLGLEVRCTNTINELLSQKCPIEVTVPGTDIIRIDETEEHKHAMVRHADKTNDTFWAFTDFYTKMRIVEEILKQTAVE